MRWRQKSWGRIFRGAEETKLGFVMARPVQVAPAIRVQAKWLIVSLVMTFIAPLTRHPSNPRARHSLPVLPLSGRQLPVTTHTFGAFASERRVLRLSGRVDGVAWWLLSLIASLCAAQAARNTTRRWTTVDASSDTGWRGSGGGVLGDEGEEGTSTVCCRIGTWQWRLMEGWLLFGGRLGGGIDWLFHSGLYRDVWLVDRWKENCSLFWWMAGMRDRLILSASLVLGQMASIIWMDSSCCRRGDENVAVTWEGRKGGRKSYCFPGDTNAVL